MTKQDILIELNRIYRDVTNETLELKLSTVINEVPGWDSLANLSIISEAQDIFKVKFTTKDIFEFRTIDDICTAALNNNR